MSTNIIGRICDSADDIPRYRLEEHISGDTWGGLAVTVVDSDGDHVDLTGASIRMEARRHWADVDPLVELSVGSGITISDAASGQFRVGPIPVAVDPSRLRSGRLSLGWEARVTFATGEVKTVAAGTLPITLDVSR